MKFEIFSESIVIFGFLTVVTLVKTIGPTHAIITKIASGTINLRYITNLVRGLSVPRVDVEMVETESTLREE